MRFSCFPTTVIALASALSVSAVDFRYRAYQGGNCNHGDSPGSMFPDGNIDPASGVINACFTVEFPGFFPIVNTLEIDHNFDGTSAEVVTFCNDQCGGGQSGGQKGLYCYYPPSGCTIGSFVFA